MSRSGRRAKEELVTSTSSSITLDELPNDCLITILKNLSYDEIAQKRLINKKFNFVCGHMLTAGLKLADETKNKEWKRVRGLVPRRESERRVHPLSRHLEVLSSLDTRTALLNMTYQRYIESKQCPFIPGKVLDEIFSVLRKVASGNALARSHEVLKELRDISSMAIEHFDEVIAPRLRSKEAFFSLQVPPAPMLDISSPMEHLTGSVIFRQSGFTTGGSGSGSHHHHHLLHHVGSPSSTPLSSRFVAGDDPSRELREKMNRMMEEMKSLNNRVQDLERQQSLAVSSPTSSSLASPGAASSGSSDRATIELLTAEVKMLSNKVKELEKDPGGEIKPSELDVKPEVKSTRGRDNPPEPEPKKRARRKGRDDDERESKRTRK